MKPRKVVKIDKSENKESNINCLKINNGNSFDNDDLHEKMNKNLENSLLILQNILPNVKEDDENYDPAKPNNYEAVNIILIKVLYERKLKLKEEEIKDKLKKSQEQKNKPKLVNTSIIRDYQGNNKNNNVYFNKIEKNEINEIHIETMITNNNNSRTNNFEFEDNILPKKKISTGEKVKNMLDKMGWKGLGKTSSNKRTR